MFLQGKGGRGRVSDCELLDLEIELSSVGSSSPCVLSGVSQIYQEVAIEVVNGFRTIQRMTIPSRTETRAQVRLCTLL